MLLAVGGAGYNDSRGGIGWGVWHGVCCHAGWGGARGVDCKVMAVKVIAGGWLRMFACRVAHNGGENDAPRPQCVGIAAAGWVVAEKAWGDKGGYEHKGLDAFCAGRCGLDPIGAVAHRSSVTLLSIPAIDELWPCNK